MKFGFNTGLAICFTSLLMIPKGAVAEVPEQWSPVDPFPSQSVYYSGTEKLSWVRQSKNSRLLSAF